MVMLEKSLAEAMNAKFIGRTEAAESSKVIILGHGYGGDQSVWDKILPTLTQNYKVLVFDWLFSGAAKDPNLFEPQNYSSYDDLADDLLSLLDEMKLSASSSSSPLIYVGHSMAGMVGCIASIKRANIFDSLILVGASPRYLNAENYEGGFKDSEIDDILSNIETNFHNWAAFFTSLVVDPKDQPSVSKFEKCIRRMRPDVALPMAKIVFRCDERHILKKTTIPCTIIQCTSDIVVPNCVAEYMQKNIKGKSSVEMVECEGHFPQLTAHVQFLEVLSRVLGFKYVAVDQENEN